MRTRILIASLAGLVSVALAASFLTVDAVIKDAKKLNGKEVTVRGKVDAFKAKTSKSGNKYTTFKLKGETKVLNVYLRDHLSPEPKNGYVVEVKGIYRESKKVGEITFKNEVDATKVAGKKFGVKIISGSK